MEGFDVDPFMTQNNECELLPNNKPTRHFGKRKA
jgi:hypothetical protein